MDRLISLLAEAAKIDFPHTALATAYTDGCDALHNGDALAIERAATVLARRLNTFKR